MGGNQNKTSAKELRGTARREKCLELRLAGFSYKQIGTALGISAQAAHKHVTKGLEDLRASTKEKAENVRDMELARLDQMLLRQYQRAVEGDRDSIETVLKIMARRAKYLGIESLGKLELGGELKTNDGISISEVLASVDDPDQRDAVLAALRAALERKHEGRLPPRLGP